MRYTVAWTEKATSQLAEIWLKAIDRDAVTAASHQIDRALAEEPLDERHEIVSRFGTVVRVPVGVDFGVDEQNRLVIVVAVWPVFED